MKVYYQSDVGKIRKNNQDSVYGNVLENGAFAMVCDGMGGAHGGDVASKTAVAAVLSALPEVWPDKLSDAEIEDILRNAAATANKEVYSLASNDPKLQGMGTTLVFALIYNDVLYTIHAGDSRAYLIGDGYIRRLTKDHSVVQQLVDKGVISEHEAMSHPKRNIITRALGVNSFIDINFARQEYHSNEKLLLCSDGLTNHVSDEEILELSKEYQAQTLCSMLIDAANNAGGRDNISVAIISGE